ncbi:acyl-CoA thioesterase [Tenuifilaceae bacterium CYCD]|nr:acyl-CoA thioesterase [Tenuifilaceae bacterium CYCD]
MVEKILNTETRQFKVAFPSTLNDNHTLFGGIAMQWMDEVAYITARRFAQQKMVTVSVDKIKFLQPINSGSIVEVVGRVSKVKNAIIEIQTNVYIEEMLVKKNAIEAVFTFAAVNNLNKPVRIFIEKEY